MQRMPFGLLGLLTVLASAGIASAADPDRFDGRWNVVLACPRSPDGALPFTFRFVADVHGGVLHGENGQQNQPGWMSLDGRIEPDGAAALQAHGLTGHSAYNINQTARGVPYEHDVTARFDAAHGAGTWVAFRTCDFTFTRQ
jgi:hypothetical protein